MKGSISYYSDRLQWAVCWPYRDLESGQYKVKRLFKYKGKKLYKTHPSDNPRKDRGLQNAQKLLGWMQKDWEDGAFRLDKYSAEAPTDVPDFLNDWLKAVDSTLEPATVKDYTNSINKHLIPFFQKHPVSLHEIEFDTLMLLLASIGRSGKGKRNTMYCLHAALDFAHRSKKIPAMPPFPKKKDYQIVDPVVRWIPEERQDKILDAIPGHCRPIFLWLKYHFRRPGEACALYWEDYDPQEDVFWVKRAFSNRVLVQRIKEGKVQKVPCMSGFKPTMKKMSRVVGSPFMFVNPLGRKPGKPYQVYVLERMWDKACDQVGEDIPLYSGLKHSRCSHFRNVLGYSMEDLQVCTGHADIRSLEKYTETTVALKRDLMEGKVVRMKERKVQNG